MEEAVSTLGCLASDTFTVLGATSACLSCFRTLHTGVPPSAADLGLYASLGAGAASSAAANRLFGGDLHSSLDDSLYSDAYSEEFNSFRDPGPDAGPWFSQQSPINSGLSLDEDLEVRCAATLAGWVFVEFHV